MKLLDRRLSQREIPMECGEREQLWMNDLEWEVFCVSMQTMTLFVKKRNPLAKVDGRDRDEREKKDSDLEVEVDGLMTRD